jgi:integrase
MSIAAPEPAWAEVPDSIIWPGPETVVLLNRELVPEADIGKLSRFRQDRWHLNEAIFEQDAKPCSISFTAIPAPLRLMARHYVWQQINADAPPSIKRGRSSIATIHVAWVYFKAFALWLHSRGVTALTQVSPPLLDDYLTSLIEDDSLDLNAKFRRANEVRRLWCYRVLLPEEMRLPPMPPWNGDTASELFGRYRTERENLTRRISEDAMQSLLAWAIRFVEDFSADILAAHAEYLLLRSHSPEGRRAAGPATYPPAGQIGTRMAGWLDRLRAAGGRLPGQRDADGTISIDWRHVGKVLDCSGNTRMATTPAGRMLLASGIEVADDAYLETPVTATVRGVPWHDGPFPYGAAPGLARLLSTASLIVMSYLSGARPGEVLNLRRGCISYDNASDLWLMSGVFFKNAVDAAGSKLPAGAPRRDPWVVVKVVADAVAILERLHGHQMLFPSRLEPHRHPHETRRKGESRTGQLIIADLSDFTDWCNIQASRLTIGQIPPDRNGPLTAARFRRTLAWFIRRRPRGLVAGSIQYGHVHTRLIQGYAGDYDSGFPDEYAFEDALARLDELGADQQALSSGEHVSGPAARAYRERVTAAGGQFAGRVLTSRRQARDLIANPLLKIFHGDGMTCVFDPRQAACQLRGTADDPTVTPDIDDCRPRCPNIAHTDRDITVVRARRDQLAQIVADPLAPPIRHQRDKTELERLESVLRAHDTTKATP